MNNLANYKNIIGVLVIVALLIFNIQTCMTNKDLKSEITSKDKALIALNDTIQVSIKNGIATYTKKAVEINPDDIINSAIFQTLSDDQKKFYTEMSKLKGLVAASNAKLNYQDSILKSISLSTSQYTSLTDSTICFNRGSNIEFKDTTTKMKWVADLKIDQPMKLNLKWDYNLNITTTFTRDKKKDLYVNYIVDDPKVKITSINSIKVPNDIEGKTKFQIFLDKNKKTFRIIGVGIIFSGGFYLGNAISH